MSLESIATYVQSLPFSAAMRGETSGTAWLFPIVETCHIFMLAIVFGSIAMMDLRLLGVASKNTSITRLASETLPWTWTAWVAAAITGSMMYAAKAVVYTENFQVRMKFLCMGLAGINMLVFHFGAYRSVSAWDASPSPPSAARVAGGLSLSLWIAVIFFGRWIGFTT